MHEFSSISVSAFEADTLAAKLTAQAAEGWDVVAIVNADSKVIAYLRREAGAAAAEPVESVAGDATSPAFVAAVTTPEEEPAGWAAEPEPAATAATAAAVTAATAEPVLPASTPAAAEPVAAAAAEPVVQPAAEPVVQPVQQPAQQASVAPAGWYADPSGRYELRYWDGSQWTEHVSRAGQQFTDPPVA